MPDVGTRLKSWQGLGEKVRARELQIFCTLFVPFSADSMLTIRYHAHYAHHAQEGLKTRRSGLLCNFNKLGDLIFL